MNVGLHKEKYERTNALSSADAVGGRLRRNVRLLALCLDIP